MKHEYTQQIKKIALQLNEGEQLSDIEKVLLIPAGMTKKVLSKNPFLLTEHEAGII